MRKCVAFEMCVMVLALGMLSSIQAEIVKVENEALQLGFDAKAGGACIAFAVKDANPPLPLQPDYAFMRPIFEPEQATKPVAPIAFTATPTNDAQGAGIVFQALLTEASSSRDVADMTFERRVWLPKGKRYLEVEEALINKTPDVMGARVGTINAFLLDSQKDSNEYYLPTERTILQIVRTSIARYYTWAGTWDYTPVENWMGAANPKSAWSFALVLDPKLDAFYATGIGSTCGWLLDGGITEPGATFRSSYTIIPVKGFRGFVHASRRLLADVTVVAQDGGVTVEHTIAGGVAELGKVTLETTLMGARTKQESKLATLEFADVGVDGVSQKAQLAQPQSEPLVIKVTAKGDGWQEVYEAYYEGKFLSTIYPGYPWVPEYSRKKAF
ncbi:MAG: hypothetical protein PHR35_20350 [Kiritimatiellae bacterium]|nr:hypothetical protein [Kiritimatiellia bacterium]